ncbi:MAG: 2OG-Fe(II) oxygenase [Chryseolinea sp.]
MFHQYDPVANALSDNGFAVMDDFLSPSEINEILDLDAFNNHLVRFKKAGTGKNQHLQINEAIRGDYIQWLDKNSAAPPLQRYLDKLLELSAFLKESLFLSIKDHEVHLAVYPPGTFYKRHLDQFKKDDHRILSVICYLNKDWHETEGGQLRMHTPSGPLDILPISGRLVCFRSDMVEHEVMPATRERLSLTGWLLDQYGDV